MFYLWSALLLAAGALLVTEAGGTVSDVAGGSRHLDKRDPAGAQRIAGTVRNIRLDAEFACRADNALAAHFLRKAHLGCDVSAALSGVGFILGPRIAMVMVGGGLLSWLVLIPAIATWGESRTAPLFPETVALIRDMPASLIWTRYVRYIGAGAVAMTLGRDGVMYRDQAGTKVDMPSYQIDVVCTCGCGGT